MIIVNKKYNLKGKVNQKIVLISDIHYYDKRNIKHLNKLLDKIRKVSPNYICIPGDIIDQSKVHDEDDFIEWLHNLSKISKVIISLGNHEFYLSKQSKVYELNDNLLKKIKSLDNVYLLDNENIIIDDINFIGVTLPPEYYHNEENQIDILKYLYKFKTYKSYYNVLLCHSPINISNPNVLKNFDIDLILCGHMHGGITPRILRFIFKNRGLVSPSKHLLPKVCYGKLKVCDTDIIITSGITVLSHINKFRRFNFLFESEMVTITIDNR